MISKRLLVVAWIVTPLLSALSPPLSLSQTEPIQPAATKATHPVAVIDVKRVFQEYQVFKGAMTGLKQEIKDFDEKVRRRRKELVKQMEVLKTLDTNSPEYRFAEKEIATEQTKLKVDIAQRKERILEAEAEAYGATYKRIRSICGPYCREHGIVLLLRYDSQPVDLGERKSILASVNRAVVFQDKIDITQAILDLLHKKARLARRAN